MVNPGAIRLRRQRVRKARNNYRRVRINRAKWKAMKDLAECE